MESQNPRTDNAPSMSASGEEVHLPREHTGSTGGNNTKLVPVPYNISSRLPTYEEATANTNLSSNYEQIYNNQSNGVYDFDQQPNLPQLDSSVFPDSGFPQEWYDSRNGNFDQSEDDEEESKFCTRCSVLILIIIIAFVIIVAKLAYEG